jgi:Lrp/AsnC family leucine-responsive transcriptional regulator
MSLDRIDIHILSQLQQRADRTNIALAECVGLSAPACLKRVKRLKKEGYISQQVVILDPDKFGTCLHMVVEIEMERDRPELYQAFLRCVLKEPEVKQCYQVTGEVDFILIVTVPDMQTYDNFCHRVLYQDNNMRKFRTLISMRRHKFDTQISLPERANSVTLS